LTLYFSRYKLYKLQAAPSTGPSSAEYVLWLGRKAE